LIGSGNKQTLVNLVERKTGFEVHSHFTHKTYDLVSQVVITSLAYLARSDRTVIYDNEKEFADRVVEKGVERDGFIFLSGCQLVTRFK
jgi:hypothetical protein